MTDEDLVAMITALNPGRDAEDLLNALTTRSLEIILKSEIERAAGRLASAKAAEKKAPEYVDMNESQLMDVLTSLAPSAKIESVEFVTFIDDSAEVRITGDIDELSRLTNGEVGDDMEARDYVGVPTFLHKTPTGGGKSWPFSSTDGAGGKSCRLDLDKWTWGLDLDDEGETP